MLEHEHKKPAVHWNIEIWEIYSKIYFIFHLHLKERVSDMKGCFNLPNLCGEEFMEEVKANRRKPFRARTRSCEVRECGWWFEDLRNAKFLVSHLHA